MVEITQEKVRDLRDTIVSYFRKITKSDVEVVEWHFNTAGAKEGNTIELGAKLILKPRKK